MKIIFTLFTTTSLTRMQKKNNLGEKMLHVCQFMSAFANDWKSLLEVRSGENYFAASVCKTKPAN